MNFNFCAIDVETTGLDPDVHEPVELAIVPLDIPTRTIFTEKAFHTRIAATRPGLSDPQAIAVNGLDISIGRTVHEVSSLLDSWRARTGIDIITPVGHNLPFDIPFAKKITPHFTNACLDTMSLALFANSVAGLHCRRAVFGGLSLASVAATLGVTMKRHHSAMSDAVTAAEILFKMIEGMDDIRKLLPKEEP